MTLSILLEKYNPQKIRSIIHLTDLCGLKKSYEILIPISDINSFDIDMPQTRLFVTDNTCSNASKIAQLLPEASEEYAIFLTDATYMTPDTIKDILSMIEAYQDAGIYVTDLQYKLENEQKAYLSFNWLERLGQLSPLDFSIALRNQQILEPYPAIVFHIKKAIDSGGIEKDLGELGFWFMLLVTGFKHGVCYNPSVSFVKHSEISVLKADVDNLLKLLRLIKTKYSGLRGHFASSTVLRMFSEELKDAYIKGCLPIDIDTFFLSLVPLVKEGLQKDFLSKLLTSEDSIA